MEDDPVSKKSISHYARKAARAEQKIIELLDRSLQDDLVEAPPDLDLQKTARSRQGPQSSG